MTRNEKSAGGVRARGLSEAEVSASRAQHGENVLTPPRHKAMWRLYLEKYEDPMVRILLVAAMVSLALAFFSGDFIETVGIILAVLFATTVGFYFERDAARKFSILTAAGEEQPVKVLREGQVQMVARRDIVVGDVVLIETGDEVPADGKLFEATALEIDESGLTGEPLTAKAVAGADGSSDLPAAAYPADVVLRSSMVMSGTGRFEVTAVGDATEIGHVAREATELTGVKTPLNIQLNRLAKLISKVGTAVSALAFVAFLVHDLLTNALWHTTDYMGMAEVVLKYFMMAVTLIVMAVPEGLPMAVTLSLALNMRRMLKSNNLVRHLHASETMGAVTVVCTDKTGTLTQNRMTVMEMMGAGGTMLDADSADRNCPQLFSSIALNTTAHRGVGNPTEVALLNWLPKDYDFEAVRDSHPIAARLPFSTERKYMATEAVGRLYVKGAPEIVLDLCDLDAAERQRIDSQLRQWQQRAMRTLAFAVKATAGNGAANADGEIADVSHLTFVAVCAISDPIRSDVPEAMSECREAGINVKIVTGDTGATALEIGRQAGLAVQASAAEEGSRAISGPDFAALSDKEAEKAASYINIMYRARPHDKQRLVELLQRQGEVVAVTGDGTNDAPALNRAHVGLSLGSGTGVAKEASDITLIDDSFRSLVQAVMWGRSLYKNIQRFIFFQLVVNVTALLLVLAGSCIGTELPLTVTQILWVNLIMDTFAAMALASLPPSREVMGVPPRKQSEFIITPPMARGIAFWGLAFFLLMFTFLYHIEQTDGGITVGELTIFFTVFVMLQWWNLLNAKALGSRHSAFRHLLRSRGLLFVLAMTLVGQWLIVTFGGRMFRTEPLSWQTWLTIFAATSPVLILGEVYRLILRVKKK